MLDELVKELEYLRKRVKRLTEENIRLRLEHEFAFNSWKLSVKRASTLSLSLAKATEELDPITLVRVRPALTIRGKTNGKAKPI